MLSSIAKGLTAQGRRSMSTVRYTEFGHPLTVLKCVQQFPLRIGHEN